MIPTAQDWTYRNRDFRDSEPYTLADVVEGMGYDLGLTDYPIFDESYRERLNTAIVSHFWYRRIAADTPAMFVYYLNRRMNERMPTYNAIYKRLQGTKFDPLATSQSWSESHAADTSSASEKSDSGQTSTTTNSTTPQVWLENPEGTRYMDALAKSDATGAATGESESTGTSDAESYVHSIDSGISQSIYELIESGVLAPDTLVFDMLEPLFMQFLDDQPY